MSNNLAAELLRSLVIVFPNIKDIYGSFWAECIDEVIDTWSHYGQLANKDLPRIHASLRLHAVLRLLANQESNEDLSEYWIEMKAAMADALLNLAVAQSSV